MENPPLTGGFPTQRTSNEGRYYMPSRYHKTHAAWPFSTRFAFPWPSHAYSPTAEITCPSWCLPTFLTLHGPLTRYVKLRVAHVSRMPWTFSPPRRLSDPHVHHSTCVTRVSWCMPRSLTTGFLWSRETFPVFLAHAQPDILRIW